MAIESIDLYGPPSYGPLGYSLAASRSGVVEGQAIHTPENPSHYLSSAIAIAKWQASSGNTSGGSYHCIFGLKDGADPSKRSNWVMVRTVPWNQAAGGLSSKRTTDVWGPGRFPWIEANMTATSYRDPNAFLHQPAWSGKAAWYVANGIPRGLLEVHAELTMVLEDAYNYNALLTLHRHWQLNRTDPGNLDSAVKLLEVYQEMKNPEPEPEPEPQQSFVDVPPDHKWFTEIEWAAANRLTTWSGRTGYFRPENPITRGDLARILWKALNSRTSSLMATTGIFDKDRLDARSRVNASIPIRPASSTPLGPSEDHQIPTEEELEEFTPSPAEMRGVLSSLRSIEEE